MGQTPSASGWGSASIIDPHVVTHTYS